MKVRIPLFSPALLISSLIIQACNHIPLNVVPAPSDKLPSLGADKNSVTVSGISSGAFMAVQLGVAYSDQIRGVTSIAGGVYSCALGRSDLAMGLCMKTPDKINVPTYTNLVHESFKKKLIADPKNIAQQKVFIIDGTEDKVVQPQAGPKLVEFYKAFHVQPKTEFGLKMGHGFPSNQATNKCDDNRLPWTNNCHYEGAQKIFENMYGTADAPIKAPTAAVDPKKLSGELLKFDQTEFTTADSWMLNYGHVYIPKACRAAGSACKVHVALHGCLQAPNLVGNAFVEEAGYNLWADQNRIIVLYPATTASVKNANGCWDWYGYTGSDYATRNAPQMTAIMKMVDKLTAK